MKLLPILLINVLVAGGAVLTYDAVKADPAPQETRHEAPALDDGIEMTSTAPDEVVIDGPRLEGNADQAIFKRLEDQEREIASLKQLVAKLSPLAVGSEDGVAVEGHRGPLPTINLDPVDTDVENPVFDEQTLETLTAYMKEARDRERKQNEINRMKDRLARLGVELAPDEQNAVVDATMAHQNKRREAMRKIWQGGARPTNEEERNAMRETMRKEMETLNEEYKTTIYALVPATEAETIVSGMSGGGGMGRIRGDMGGRRRGGGGR